MAKKNVIFEDIASRGKKHGVSTFPHIPYSQYDPHDIERIRKQAYQEGLKEGQEKANEQKTDAEQQGEKEGIKEHHKEEAKEEVAAKQKLEQLTKRDDIILLEAKTFFPLDLFPTRLIIDTTKINIIYKQFFATEQITTVNLKDLLDVWVETSLFLGNLNIKYLPKSESMGMVEPMQEKIMLLKRDDALTANYILKGILVARREDIDITKISPQKLIGTIEEIGKTEGSL